MPLNKISASSIKAFQTCSQKFRLSYVEGLRPEIDTENLRVGSSWHALFEAYGNAAPGEGMDAAIAHLNQRYANVPIYLTPEEWALERQILLTSFIAYHWFYQNDPLEFLANELPFDLPLHEPRTGMPLSVKSVVRTGKIDHVIRRNGSVCNLERKSTSRSVASDSDFWLRWQKDVQISSYALAFRDMREAGLLPFAVRDGETFGNSLLDVWHKPTTKPKMLTQAATAEFITNGLYCGQTFVVVADGPNVSVDGESVVVEPGKKGFALRESVGMYGARLLAEIYESPDKFFARREISRTDQELREFRVELYNIYRAQTAFSTGNLWFSNENSCDTPYRCQFRGICFGPGAPSVCDGTTVPAGFKRLAFADFRINGREVEV